MTTNHLERLDDALIRPGRVDVKVEFQRADEKIMTQLFYFVFKTFEGDNHDPDRSIKGCGPDPAKFAEYNESVELLAKEFAAKVPKLEFSPAEIMSLLLVNKQSPRQAVDNVEVWMEKIKEEKKKVKRADSWLFSE
jgi:chaperone BCS1